MTADSRYNNASKSQKSSFFSFCRAIYGRYSGVNQWIYTPMTRPFLFVRDRQWQ